MFLIKMSKREKSSSESSDDQCSSCHENFIIADGKECNFCYTEFHHKFHLDCYLKLNGEYPTCKTKISDDQESYESISDIKMYNLFERTYKLKKMIELDNNPDKKQRFATECLIILKEYVNFSKIFEYGLRNVFISYFENDSNQFAEQSYILDTMSERINDFILEETNNQKHKSLPYDLFLFLLKLKNNLDYPDIMNK